MKQTGNFPILDCIEQEWILLKITFYAHLSDFLRRRHAEMAQEVEGFESEYLLKVNLDDVAAHLEEKYRLEPVVLRVEHIYIAEHGDTKINVSGNPKYGGTHFGESLLIPATFVVFAVPFAGNWPIFKLQPSMFSSCPPRAKIKGQELRFRYTNANHDQVAIKREFDQELESTREHVGWAEDDVLRFNQDLPTQIRQRLERRKEKFVKDKGLVEGLGFPIKVRQEVTTYAPVIRKKLPVPAVKNETSLRPEPRLEQSHYDHILSVIFNMNLVMERSPRAFRHMGEEDLRTHILVQLNGHYEGRSTGETFNYEGKTDILVRENGKNVFIAECKIWKGGEVFTATVDQLLGYAAWRDTKTAIIVFNRNKNLSSVLAQVPELMRKHPNFRQQVESYTSETGFRFIMTHKDDKKREMMVTVLVFDVPEAKATDKPDATQA